MKRILLVSLLSTPLHAGLAPLGEHLDIRFRWESGAWTCEAVTYDGGEIAHDLDTVFLPLSDKPYIGNQPALSGARATQPASSAFDFTGIDDGEPLWFAVQGTPGIGEAWPGFENNQSGVFGSYIPADDRVSQTNAQPWIRVSLVEYIPPHGKDTHFSMWNTTTGNPPTVWMSTFDGDVENSYFYTQGSHNHVSWGFSAQGIHKVRLRASAFLGPGETNPTDWSDTFTFTFAVGTFAKWQATWFDAAELDDPDICGPSADADADGLANLLEYAFGTNPRNGGTAPHSEGLGLPAFSLTEDGGTIYQTLVFPRRRAEDRLNPETYRPLFASSPAGPWSDLDVETSAADFPPELDDLNAEWELVTARRAVTPGATAGFGRVEVVSGD